MAKKEKDEMFDEAEPQAAVPANPQGANLPTEKYAREYIPDEELPMPRLRIIQKDTEDQAAGVFVNTQTEEVFAEVECILLGIRRGRVRWDSTLKNMDEPLCRSRDGITGAGDPGGSCVKCPEAVWNEDEKPRCALVYDFVGLDATGAPFLFSVSRTGIKPARNFIAAAQRRRKPLYYTGCVITLRKVERPATYYVPVFKRAGEIPVEQWEEFEGILAQIEGALERTPTAAVDTDNGGAAEY